MKKATKKSAARTAVPPDTTGEASKPSSKRVPAQAALKKAAPKKAAPKKLAPKKMLAKKLAPRPAAVAPSAITIAPPGTNADSTVLDRLYATIMDRRTADPARSHSARLLSRGPAKVAQKFGEEAVECLIEAVANNPTALVAESADVLYHLVVMWVASGIAPDQVWAELHRREGISGVVEKASRANPLIGTTKIP